MVQLLIIQILLIAAHAVEIRPPQTIVVLEKAPILLTTEIQLQNVRLAPVSLPNLSTLVCPLGTSPAEELAHSFGSLVDECWTHLDRLGSQTDSEKVSSYNDVCTCLQQGRTPAGAALNQAPQTSASRRALSAAVSSIFRTDNQHLVVAPTQEELNRNIREQSQLLQSMRNGMLFQASLLGATPEDNRDLASAYSQNYFDRHSRGMNAKIVEAQEALSRRFHDFGGINLGARNYRLNLTTLQPPEFDSRLLTGEPYHHSCVSPREYFAFKQIPYEDDFYHMMAQDSFSPAEWNFDTLMERFTAVSGRYGSLRDALENNPEAKKLYQKLDFLERNPLYKNFLSAHSGGDDANGNPLHRADDPALLRRKQQLLGYIRDAYKPQDANCQGCKLELISSGKLNTLKDRANQFFRSPEISRFATEEGVHDVNELLASFPQTALSARPTTADEAARAFSVTDRTHSAFFTPAADAETATEGDGHELFRGTTPNLQQILTQSGLDSIRTMCPFLSRTVAMGNNNQALRELQQRWATAFITNPDENPDLKAFEESTCGPHSANGGPPYVDFDQFRRQTCGSLDCGERKDILSQFLHRFPRPQIKGSWDGSVYAAFLASDRTQAVTATIAREVQNQTMTLADRESSVSQSLRRFDTSGDLLPEFQDSQSASVSKDPKNSGAFVSEPKVRADSPQGTAAQNAIPFFQATETPLASAAVSLPGVPVPETKIGSASSSNGSSSSAASDPELERLRQELATLRGQRDDEQAQQRQGLEQRIHELENRNTTTSERLASRDATRSLEPLDRSGPAGVSNVPTQLYNSVPVVSSATNAVAGGPVTPSTTDPGRAPANFQPGSLPSSLGGTSSLSAAASSVGRSGSTFNEELLARNGVMVRAGAAQTPVGGIILAQPRDEAGMGQMRQGISDTKEITVSSEAFQTLASQGQLNPVVERELRSKLSEVGNVELIVSTPGQRDNLRYILKEISGRLVLQPIQRTARMEDLRNFLRN